MKSKIGSLIIFTLVFQLNCLQGFADSQRFATITEVNGKAEYRAMGAEWKPAQAGVVLRQNDELRTASGSTAKLLLDDEGKTGNFELKSESRLRLAELTMNDVTGDKTTLLDLAIGDVLVHAEKLQGNSKFEVRTPNSTTGVRGTTFLVSAKPRKNA